LSCNAFLHTCSSVGFLWHSAYAELTLPLQGVIKLTNAAIQKYPNELVFKSLKAVALQRTGKSDEAMQVGSLQQLLAGGILQSISYTAVAVDVILAFSTSPALSDWLVDEPMPVAHQPESYLMSV
jgi:hypothetical protein